MGFGNNVISNVSSEIDIFKFSKLLKFIDTAYSRDKIYLEQKTEDDLYLVFEVPVDFEEEKYSLHLKKKK